MWRAVAREQSKLSPAHVDLQEARDCLRAVRLG